MNCQNPECGKAITGSTLKKYCNGRCRQRTYYLRQTANGPRIRYTAKSISKVQIEANIERIGQRNDNKIGFTDRFLQARGTIHAHRVG